MADILKKWLLDVNNTNDTIEKPKKQKQKLESSSQDKKSVFNKASVMDRLMGDADIVKIVIEAFLVEIPGKIELLVKHTDAAEYSEAKQLAHAIKGAAGNIGAEDLYTKLLKIEHAESGAAINDKVPDLKEGFQKLKNILKREI